MFNKYKITRYILAIFILAFIFLLDFLGFLSLNFSRRLAAHWQAKNYKYLFNLTKPIRNLRQLWQLRAHLEDLEYRYRETVVQLGELTSLREENAALREILENSDRTLQSTLISRPISSFARPVLALNDQSRVRVGSVVLGRGILLGIIEDVESSQARVLLLKNMFQQGILAKTESGVKGIVKGDGKHILFTEVNSGESIMVNERILTVGQEGIAADIFIGRISSLKTQNPAKATQEALIEQLLSFYELSLVEIQP